MEDYQSIFQRLWQHEENEVVEFKKASETKYQYSIDGIDMGKINSSALNKILKQVQKLTAEK